MSPRPRPIVAAGLALLTLGSARAASRVAQDGSTTSAAPASVPGGLDLAGLDRDVAPGDDFFAFANGAWIKSTEIPADRSSWGVDGMLSELTARRVADLIAAAARSKGPQGSEEKKIGDYYTTFMDEAGIEAKGMKPLQASLLAIEAIRDGRDLARVLGSTLRADVDPLNSTDFHTDNLFGLWIAQDLNDPSRYSPFLLQGGLGLPDRDYYLDPSPRMADIRTRYEAHVAAVLRLAGVAGSDGKAVRILGLEHRIAAVHASLLESQDVRKGNNHWKRRDFASRAPGLDWAAFLEAAGLAGQDDFVVWQPGALTGISALVRDEPLAVWKDYLTLRAIERASPLLPRAFVLERFAFYGRVLAGTEALSERWKRAVAATDTALGEAVGKLYVARYFPPSEKERAQEMVRNEMAAFGQRIDRLPWMAEATKAKARAKLAILKVGVGYPDRWRDYGALEVVPGDALGNAERASLFEYRYNLDKLGRPVDRGEWVMNPQLVNAVNLPAMNALNFPAAYLQPPYFDPARPAAMDYGAVGATIGHEIIHSFDDQGALFDASGRLAEWWTKEDFAHFEEAAGRLIRQYDGYRPLPDLALNGRLTLSENIADVAGLAVAYDAYRLSLAGQEAPVVQGLTGDQQFFLSYAQSWREKSREARLRRQVLTDGHAPGQYRANAVRNLDAWYAAFEVKPGQGLFLSPQDRVRVW